jgi:anti-sigma28 factor (negative regulator of flagellin synthesis)
MLLLFDSGSNLVSSFELEGRNLCLIAAPGPGGSSTGSPSDEPTFTERILALLDHICAIDQTMDEARSTKIANIKKAIAEGTYHVSAAEVARRIIDQIDEP